MIHCIKLSHIYMITKIIYIHVRLNESYIIVLDKHTISLRCYDLIQINNMIFVRKNKSL